MLTFPVTFWGSGATRTYITSPTPSFGSASSFTFTSVSLGSALGTSLVLVVAHAWDVSGDGRQLNTVTVGGTGASLIVKTVGTVTSNQDASVGIWTISTASTSANIVVTTTNTVQGCGVDVYRLNNLASATASATASNHTTSNGTSISTTLAVLANGLAIQGCSVNGLGSETISGTGTTVDHTQNLVGDADFAEWAGSAQNLGAQTLTLSNTYSSGVAGLVGAAWS